MQRTAKRPRSLIKNLLRIHSPRCRRPQNVWLRKLGRQDVDFLDRGWLRKEVRGLGHERCRHLAGQVSLPARFVRERVEDAERRGTELNAEPRDRGRLLLDERKSRLEKRRDLCFLAWLCLETDEERYVDHGVLLAMRMRRNNAHPDSSIYVRRESAPCGLNAGCKSLVAQDNYSKPEYLVIVLVSKAQ